MNILQILIINTTLKFSTVSPKKTKKKRGGEKKRKKKTRTKLGKKRSYAPCLCHCGMQSLGNGHGQEEEGEGQANFGGMYVALNQRVVISSPVVCHTVQKVTTFHLDNAKHPVSVSIVHADAAAMAQAGAPRDRNST